MQSRSGRWIVRALGVVLVSGAITVAAQSAGDSQGQNAARPVVRNATRTDTTVPLRRMPELPPTPAVLGEIFERPFKLLPNREGSTAPAAPDPVLQAPISEPATVTTGPNFEGVSNVNGVLPPDTVGDIGPSHYIQMVNLSFAIWNRSGNLLYGPVNNKTLWQGFGGPCETRNDGDPIVLYDHLADRWMMSQFALPNFPRGPFYQCIAVSQTPDPLGAWHRYEFTIHQSKLNDYPKFGVWPDGYYMAINQFKCNMLFCTWEGQGVVAFERDQMLNGQLAQMVYFDLESVDANLGGMLPSELDGPPPSAGAPNYFVQIDDDAWGYSPDQAQIWQFSVNWSNPTTSTFTHMANLGTAAFDSNMCGYARNCIPQPVTSVKVDAISDRLMYRLQYRNFGTHQSLMVNHTVDVDGSDRAGVRWYELRNTGSGWTMHQQGTFSPDSNHRWMGSVAMNNQGDVALGYSVSSTGIYPSIRATGRLAEDALGQMTQGEIEIMTGSGYQTHSAGRWGDYSAMSVDPVDDCTFWYTQEYYAVAGSAPWQTRIGSFKLRDCGPVVNAPTASIFSPPSGAEVSGQVTIQISASDVEDAAGTLTVEWNIDGGPWAPAAYNSVTGYYEASWDTTSVSDGSHTINSRATDSDENTGSGSNGVVVNNANDPPTASFSFSCTGLTCDFDGSASSDPDGSISSYSWNFGDGSPAGSGATVSHTFASGGSYTVTLTVTDNEGAADDESKSVTVAEATGTHVGDLDGSKSNNGSTWTATVTITVHDSGHAVLSSATVTGSWSNNGATSNCITNGTGTCQVSQSGIRKNVGSVTFSVSSVTHSTGTYNSAANHDPDGDSNGTSITVTKP